MQILNQFAGKSDVFGGHASISSSSPIAEQPRTRYSTSISMISAGSGFSPNRSEPGSCRNFRPKRERRTVFFLSGASPKPSLK
jgi:hypothetical protein